MLWRFYSSKPLAMTFIMKRVTRSMLAFIAFTGAMALHAAAIKTGTNTRVTQIAERYDAETMALGPMTAHSTQSDERYARGLAITTDPNQWLGHLMLELLRAVR